MVVSMKSDAAAHFTTGLNYDVIKSTYTHTHIYIYSKFSTVVEGDPQVSIFDTYYTAV